MDTEMPPKEVAASAVTEQVYRVFPNDLNAHGTVFGGLIMAQMDRLCSVVAGRHAGGVAVTASVDSLHFMEPARHGDVLVMHASVNRAWRTSMEVGCKVEAESGEGGPRRHILSAFLTFVATDSDGRPRSVPAAVPATAAQQQRFAAAELRRRNRLGEAEQLKRLRGT